MILVIDINKGIQNQTAECIALGEIMQLNLMVVLNKIDLFKKKSEISKKIKNFKKFFKKTQYPNCDNLEIIPFSCKDESVTKMKLIEGIVNS